MRNQRNEGIIDDNFIYQKRRDIRNQRNEGIIDDAINDYKKGSEGI